jgi:hypothetical protein
MAVPALMALPLLNATAMTDFMARSVNSFAAHHVLRENLPPFLVGAYPTFSASRIQIALKTRLSQLKAHRRRIVTARTVPTVMRPQA